MSLVLASGALAYCGVVHQYHVDIRVSIGHTQYIGAATVPLPFEVSTMVATAWSGFYGDGIGSTGAYSVLVNKPPRRYAAKRVVNREQFRALTALFGGLIGAVSGANVTATHKRVGNESANGQVGLGVAGGGLVTIETITDINRNTTAADVTALKEILFNVQQRPVPYPVDLSSNGGKALA